MQENNNKEQVLSNTELEQIHAYWRAANYLAVGQIFLLNNPLLQEPLKLEHIKPRLLGHWGTTPGLNFIYIHMNRLIKKYDLSAIFMAGPGHGGPAVVANVYLEGTYSEAYPEISQDLPGMQKLFKQFSFPGGIPSHVAADIPGSIHEGGELGYVVAHAYGAVFDNPELITCCVVGDGEAETGPLAASWHSNKFLNPISDGAVLPILHLNGYKIANPTLLSRISETELLQLFKGYGYQPYIVKGSEPLVMHQLMAKTMENAIQEIKQIQKKARENNDPTRPLWPMIILDTPKGWTCPAIIENKKVEGFWRSHQVPMTNFAKNPRYIGILEQWLKSYKPEELFNKNGKLRTDLVDLPPKGNRRMSANPHANGGMLLQDLKMPDFKSYAVPVDKPGTQTYESARAMGIFLRDIMQANSASKNFRIVGPDETASNRLDAVFEVTNRVFNAKILPEDDHLAADGRVLEVLSEHMCQGWLEGYLLTGRHGFFSCYEAFIHIVSSMFNQHAKWLKVTSKIPFRRPIASLNYFLTSHVWRQDHNGFSHQDPGFVDHVVNKKSEVIRVYFPPDANTMLSVTDHCLRSRNFVNVIIGGKQPALQYLSMADAVRHCTKGIGVWQWASNDQTSEPDAVMACAGDIPTLETLAAVDILRQHVPDIKLRVVNVVDLMALQPPGEHPHGLSDIEFDELFTQDKPIIFAFHGYPLLVHRLTYRRTNHKNLHVRGYKEEGTTTTPFDMVVLNDLDRFHLAMDTLERIPRFAAQRLQLREFVKEKLIDHKNYIYQHGEDLPEIQNWQWPY